MSCGQQQRRAGPQVLEAGDVMLLSPMYTHRVEALSATARVPTSFPSTATRDNPHSLLTLQGSALFPFWYYSHDVETPPYLLLVLGSWVDVRQQLYHSLFPTRVLHGF